jgi:hypothetical protein
MAGRAGPVFTAPDIAGKPAASETTLISAKNYVVAALDGITAGKPVTVATTRAYGCSIRYRGA